MDLEEDDPDDQIGVAAPQTGVRQIDRDGRVHQFTLLKKIEEVADMIVAKGNQTMSLVTDTFNSTATLFTGFDLKGKYIASNVCRP